jgi:hypothetical protein
LVFWTEDDDWRRELHTGGFPGEGRLLVYCGETVVTAESVQMGQATYTLRPHALTMVSPVASLPT